MFDFEQERVALLEAFDTWDEIDEMLASLKLTLDADAMTDAVRERAAAMAGESPRALRMLEKATARLVKAADPRVVLRGYMAERRRDGVVLNNTRFRGHRLSLAFRSCPYGIAYAMSLGPEVDRIIEEARERRETAGFVYDQAASRLAEYAAEQVSALVRRNLPDPLGATERYSPGYCDWHLSEQKKLFGLLPPRPLGILLSRSCLMYPRKSISGVMGVGPAFVTQIYGNACIDCLHSTCRHRRVPARVE